MDPSDVDHAVVDAAVGIEDRSAIDVLAIADNHHCSAYVAIGVADFGVVTLEVVLVLLEVERDSFIEAYQGLATAKSEGL